MNFPVTMHLPIQSQEEYDAVLAALQVGIDDRQSPYATLVSLVASRAKYSDGTGMVSDLPEAWLEVGGKRLGEGRRADINRQFDTEVASHKASVVLYAREPGNTTYRVIRSRRAQNVGV